jgi:hypothetical protein
MESQGLGLSLFISPRKILKLEILIVTQRYIQNKLFDEIRLCFRKQCLRPGIRPLVLTVVEQTDGESI